MDVTVDGMKELFGDNANYDTKLVVKTLFEIDLTDNQLKIVESVAKDDKKNKRVVICCYTRYGKSFCVALGILLYLLTHTNKRILLLSPTDRQTTIIRNYIVRFLIFNANSRKLLDIYARREEKLKRELSHKRITFKNGCEILVMSTEGRAARLMGFGGDLIVMDESALISHEVYQMRITRMLGDSPNSKLIEIGNPLHKDNQMYEHWLDPKFTHIHIGYDTGIAEERITEEFIEEERKEITDTQFKILYDAEFPDATEDQLIRGDWIRNALREKPKMTEENVIRILGCDIARFGEDKTVLTYLKVYSNAFYVIEKIKEYAMQDTHVTTGYIIDMDNKYYFNKIIVDDTGLGGGVVDNLKHNKSTKKKTISFIAGKSPKKEEDKKRYLNVKAEFYIKMSKIFEAGNIIIQDNSQLIRELRQIKYEFSGDSGKLIILKAGKKSKQTDVEVSTKSPDFCFDANTLVRTESGQKPIKDIKIGEFVKTPFGNRKVTDKSTRYVEDILELKLSNNTKIITTPGHKFFNGKVFKHAITLNNQDKLTKYTNLNRLKWKLKKLLNTEAENIGFQELIKNTTTMTNTLTEKEQRKHFTGKYGKIIRKERFQKDISFTTKMKIPLTIIPKILNLLNGENTKANTLRHGSRLKNIKKKIENLLKKHNLKLSNGINLKKAESGTKNIILSLLRLLKNISISVLYAIKNIILYALNILNIVLINVGLKEITIEAMELKRKKTKVYNITVEKDHVYFANDILVSNSDSLMMAVSNIPKSGVVFDFI